MKRTLPILILLAILSVISGILMSKATWIGRVGITFFHKEYNLLKIWWQGASAVYIMLLLLFFLHYYFYQRLSLITARLLHVLLLLTAITCLYFTFDDFSNDFSHHLLGWRFHYGFYLFWIGWMLICLFFVFQKKPPTYFPIDPNSKEKAGQ